MLKSLSPIDVALIKKFSGNGSSYNLPIASETTLGGVQPASKTNAMTQAVGVDAAGALWTEPGGGGSSGGYEDTVLFEIATTEEVNKIYSDTLYNLGVAEKLCNADFIYAKATIVPTSNESYTSNGRIAAFGVFQVGVNLKWVFLQYAQNVVPKYGSTSNGEINIIFMGSYQDYSGNHVRPVIGQNTTNTSIRSNFTSFTSVPEKAILENPGNYQFVMSTDNSAFGAGTTLKIVARRYL